MQLGIKRCIELGAERIEAFADSELMVKQLTGVYKIKNEDLKVIAQDILAMIKMSSVEVVFTHIRREYNKEADRLSNVAMDQSPHR